MMRRALIALLLCLPLAAFAAVGGGSSASQSFRLPRGARAVGLGGAYTALASGANALAWNPAGLNTVRDIQIAASHLGYIQDINDDTLQLAQPIYGLGAWGLGVDYLYTSEQGYDNWGNATDAFNVFDFSAQLGFSLELPGDLWAGAVYKILRQGYANQFSMGSAFDLGLQRRALWGRLDLGFAAQNLGTPMGLGRGFGLLPITLRSGAALHLTKRWLISVDWDAQVVDYVNKVHAGSEFLWPAGAWTLAARGGWTAGPQSELGGLTGLSVGLGVQRGAFAVDYAWEPLGDLGSAHRLSLTWSRWLVY
jgi:hypothetical protein